MIAQFSFAGEGFQSLLQYEGWKIGFLRYAERFAAFRQLERHLETDEAFVLLCGSATLYTEQEQVSMQPCRVYNIPRGVWHHITVSPDATVMVVENSNTDRENTEKKYLS